LAEGGNDAPGMERLARAAHIVGWVAVLGLAAALLHPGCYILLQARLLLGAAVVVLWVVAATGRQDWLSSLPGRLTMTGLLVIIFDWTRGVSAASFKLTALEVAPSWSIIPLVVLVAAWLVEVVWGRSSHRSAGVFPPAVILSAALVIIVALICFPLFGFRFDVGADTFASLIVTALQYVGIALAGMEIFGRGAPRWAVVMLGLLLAAKVVLSTAFPG